MSLDRNISVWRGNQYPPTEYHVWIKDNGDIYININGSYVLQISPFMTDIINISLLLDNYSITLQETIDWISIYGVRDYNLNIHKGTKIRFVDSTSNKWKEYVYTAKTSEINNIQNWSLMVSENIGEELQEQISALKIVEIPTDKNSEFLTSYELHDKDSNKLGQTINIPKDKSIKDVQIADTNATIDEEGNIIAGNGSTALCIVYTLANGTYKLVKIDYSSFIEESEFADGLQVINHKVSVKIDQSTEKFISVSNAGVKVSGLQESVTRVNSIWDGNPDLVTPTLNGKWSVYKNDNSEVLPTPSFPIEYGFKAKYTGTWKWESSPSKKNPTKTSGTWGTTLTASGIPSTSFTSPDYVTNNTTYSQTIFAPKLGLMVSGQNVIPAKGDDSKAASTSISFSNRIYYGINSIKAPSESIIKGLTTVLGGRGRTISGVTTNGTQYYYYAYPKSLGALSTIIQDGAQPILGAFTRSELNITNAAGVQVALYVYVSNNPGAFTNNTLKFE